VKHAGVGILPRSMRLCHHQSSQHSWGNSALSNFLELMSECPRGVVALDYLQHIVGDLPRRPPTPTRSEQGKTLYRSIANMPLCCPRR
jgi:hypothetical protein